jgi:phospholipase/carboxylesterase
MPLDATLTPLLWEPPTEPRALVVMLHGLTMAPEALLPFAQTLGVPAVFAVPQGPVAEPDGSRSWWAVDAAKRQARLNAGPSDLHDKHPAGRPQARAALASQLNALTARWPQLPLVLLGYSQGGMLACDHTLLGTGPRPDALVLLSSTRIAFDEWQPVLASANSPVRGLPVLAMHGEQDPDLGLRAGLNLQQCLADAGAQVDWQPFAGGHEMPLVVWRRLKRFLTGSVIHPA